MNAQLGRQITLFVINMVIFSLATQNIGGTFVGCVVTAVIYQWSVGVQNGR